MKTNLLKGLMLALGALIMGTIPCYASISEEKLEFFRDDKTCMVFGEVHEIDDQVKITACGTHDNRKEYLTLTPITTVLKWVHDDQADPPYSNAVLKVQVEMGLRMYDFPNYTRVKKQYHMIKNESETEDKVPVGEWGNMYKDITYIRPDTSEHVKKNVIGQYKIDRKEELVQSQIKLCTGTSKEFSKWENKTRHHIDRADIYKITDTRYEREKGLTESLISSSSAEEYRNRRHEGQAPNCGDRKLHN